MDEVSIVDGDDFLKTDSEVTDNNEISSIGDLVIISDVDTTAYVDITTADVVPSARTPDWRESGDVRGPARVPWPSNSI